jgi:hypothetical protein
MSNNTPDTPLFRDPEIKRNYYLLFNYLEYLMDSGLNYLKREYLAQYQDDNIKKLSASSFFEFIVRDNIRAKVRNQIRAVLGAAVMCIEYYDGDNIQAEELNRIIDKKYPLYGKNDMTLIHSSVTHPAYGELRIVSKLTFRVLLLQCSKILSCKDPNIKIYEDLLRYAYKDYEECHQSVSAMFSMVDQMIDIYENNIESELINIPVYKPTFTLRNFTYVRKIYEYALRVVDKILKTAFGMEVKDP